MHEPPFLQPGDVVKLPNGQQKLVLKQEGRLVQFVDSETADHLRVWLTMMTPLHLAIHLFNVNGLEGVERWMAGRSQAQLTEYIVSEILTKHFDMLKVLSMRGALD